MKTNLSAKPMMLFAIASILLLSCSKESDTILPGGTPSGDEIPGATIGNIVDLGAVGENVRHMRTDLIPQDFFLYNSDGELSQAIAKVQLSFYVNDDGFIPSGEYSFSTSDEKAPFTFDSGILTLDANGNSIDNQIVKGLIFVNHDAGNYVFDLQVEIESGMSLAKRYNGPMVYADVSVK